MFSSLPTPQAVDFISTPRGFLMRWSGAAGANYTVQRSLNLKEPWQTEQIEVPSGPGILEYEEEQGQAEQAFYRILVQ
jgi:hypothetical protein